MHAPQHLTPKGHTTQTPLKPGPLCHGLVASEVVSNDFLSPHIWQSLPRRSLHISNSLSPRRGLGKPGQNLLRDATQMESALRSFRASMVFSLLLISRDVLGVSSALKARSTRNKRPRKTGGTYENTCCQISVGMMGARLFLVWLSWARKVPLLSPDR